MSLPQRGRLTSNLRNLGQHFPGNFNNSAAASYYYGIIRFLVGLAAGR